MDIYEEDLARFKNFHTSHVEVLFGNGRWWNGGTDNFHTSHVEVLYVPAIKTSLGSLMSIHLMLRFYV